VIVAGDGAVEVGHRSDGEVSDEAVIADDLVEKTPNIPGRLGVDVGEASDELGAGRGLLHDDLFDGLDDGRRRDQRS
jgi:hypothetical protein